jgi:flagellar hook protein FlgE
MAMMGALTTAVSGMKSQQTALDVIANNIANVNTTAYKSQTVTFSDLLSQTISSASGSTATTGSVNAQQVGLGVSVSSTDTNLSVGSTTTSSNATDVALTGAGYFIVQTGTEGEYQFTRDGSLTIDSDGNLTINGYKVCGWEAYTLDADGNKVYNTDGAVETINIYSDSYSGNKQNLAAQATTSATIGGTVDSGSEVVSGATLQNIGSTAITDWDATTSIDVVDEQGNTTEVAINLKKCATDGTTTSWYWEASGTDTTISPSSGYIAFDSNGKMVTSVTPLTSTIDTAATNTTGYSDSDISVSSGLTAGSYTVAVADSTTSGTYDITLTDPSGNTYTTTSSDGSATFSTSSGTVTLAAPTTLSTGTSTFTVAEGTTLTFDSSPLLTMTSTTAGTQAVSVEMDLSGITSTGSSSATLTGSADGYESGTASSYSISTDGTILCTYSNGEIASVGQIALAVFQNASGLEKNGENFYTTSASSGSYKTVVAGQGGSGSMTSYALELSNVDLAAEFSSMMISQRAYQANSKVISTSDDMLQSLINMVG